MKETTYVSMVSGAVAAIIASIVSAIGGFAGVYCTAEQRKLDNAAFHFVQMQAALTKMEQASRQSKYDRKDINDAVGAITLAATGMQSTVEPRIADLAMKLMSAAQNSGDAMMAEPPQRTKEEKGAFESSRKAWRDAANGDIQKRSGRAACFLAPKLDKAGEKD